MPKRILPRLVLKELVDNALDAGNDCTFGLTGNGFYIHDDGPGIEPGIIAELFSINRPLVTTKMLRIPSRGALGNGLRVVCGAVIATSGSLSVETAAGVFSVSFLEDGSSKVTRISDGSIDIGTKIVVQFGTSVKVSKADLSWAKLTHVSNIGSDFPKQTSPLWYSSDAFYEVVNAYNGPISELLEHFTLTKNQIQAIISKHGDSTGSAVTFEESEQLLTSLREYSKPINHKKLGRIGGYNGLKSFYSYITGTHKNEPGRGGIAAEIPFIVEVWGDLAPDKESVSIATMVNKTCINGTMKTQYIDNKRQALFGCGLSHGFASPPVQIVINIVTPYMPITSDGKEPNFLPMLDQIVSAIGKMGRQAKRAKKENSLISKCTQREAIEATLFEAVNKASGNGQYKFSQRQLYYAVRPGVIHLTSQEIDYNYFCSVISQYESTYGEIEGMYRDPRGTLYHPHLRQEMPVGTISVNEYNRPRWTFNKILYLEKEGFFPLLRDVMFPERFDCALLSSKGFASRAVKDLFDMLGETDEEILFFCLHDADAAGTMICQPPTTEVAGLSRG